MLLNCLPVLGRHLDRAEAVDGDEDDRELRDEADRVVHGQPEVAQYRSQLRRPVAHQYVSEMEIGKLCWWCMVVDLVVLREGGRSW